MAITTDSYIEVRDTQTALQDKIGLSKALDNYTVEEITSYCYCGADNNFIKYPLKRSDVQAFLSDVDIPFHIETDATNRMTFTVGDRTPYAGNEDLYGRVVWLQNITNVSSNVITENNCANYKLVTEMKANHYCYEWEAPQTISCGASTYGTTDWSGSDMTTHKVWYSSGGSLSYYKDFTGGEIINLSSHKIHPFFICEIDGKMYCLSIGFNINHYRSNYNFYTLDADYPPNEGYTYTSWDGTDSFDVTVATQQTWDSTFANTGWNFPYVYPRTSPGQYGWASILQGFDEDKINGFGVVGGTEFHLDMGWEFHYYFKERDDAYKLISGAGLYFKTDKIYKPIINNGYVIGYTDELSTTSDIDTWEGTTNHNIPPSPPGPAPPSYDDDDMDLTEIGFTSSIGGAGWYWIFDGPPTGLFQDFFLHAPEGSMLSQNILSCYCSALNYAWHTVDQKIVIYTNGSQTPAYESTNAYPLLYNDKNPHFVVGKFDVPRCTNTFYDFSPYTTYELFIPFCGWIGLPDTVAGRSIRVYMDCDVSTCTCKSIVMLESEGGDSIICEITGNFGAPCPIQVVEGGLYKQAAINSGLQIASGVASGIYGASAGAGALAISGFSNALQGLHNMHVAGNTNYGQTIGRAGDCSNLAGGHYCKIRITHPVVDEVVNNSIFGHTVGYLCNEIGKLKNYSGFTVCINPHITGIDCTDEEKEEIKGLLENGVIL